MAGAWEDAFGTLFTSKPIIVIFESFLGDCGKPSPIIKLGPGAGGADINRIIIRAIFEIVVLYDYYIS